MFWSKVFIATQTNQIIMPASSGRALLDLRSTGLKKISKCRQKWFTLFSNVTVPDSQKEFLYLQAHLIDLLELNLELFDQRCEEYKKKRKSLQRLLSGDALVKTDKFFKEDLDLYTERKSFLVANSFDRIVKAKDLGELLDIKAYLISNVALISYKTKQPYYF